ncbi:IS256 family transposase, partial [Streptococcus pneumoniae]|nr:IS256 family transposase [Streptococcus pneumoniae]
MRNITRKRFTSMTQFTTEFLNFLVKKRDINEFFRSALE